MEGGVGAGERAGGLPLLVPTDTLLQLIQIRVSKAGRLNLRASQQYRGRCQSQSLTRRTHAHSVNLFCATSSSTRTDTGQPPNPPFLVQFNMIKYAVLFFILFYFFTISNQRVAKFPQERGKEPEIGSKWD